MASEEIDSENIERFESGRLLDRCGKDARGTRLGRRGTGKT